MKPSAVIYLWAPDPETAQLLDSHEEHCRLYAERCGWPVVDVIRETGGDEFASHRDGLQQVYHVLRTGRAVAVLTTSISMLGGDRDTYNAVAEIIRLNPRRGGMAPPSASPHERGGGVA